MSATAANAEPEKLKFAFFASDREYAYQGVVKPFVDAVNLEGKGILEIEIYPGGALGRSYPQQAELVLRGDADMAWIQPALTPDRFNDNTIMELPGLFRDGKEATHVYTRLIGAGKLRGYEDFFPIAALGSYPLAIHTRTPVKSLAGMKDMRIRTSSRTEGAALKLLGAEPKFIPITEVADALNQGTLDGATAALEVLVDFGLSRFATYHYMLTLGSVPLTVLMNRKRFDNLPEPARNIIRKYSGVWTAQRYLASIDSYAAQIIERFKADTRRNVVYPSPEDLATARDAFERVETQWANANPHNRELLTFAEAEVAKFRSTR